MEISARLSQRLRERFSPQSLEVVNESHLHAGHGHHDGSGETHLRVRIVADAFATMGRVERHRAVNGLAADFFDEGLHALAIEARSPSEAQR
jgi:BolA family transcriptional regulator, general stress-responsive regulator